MNRGFISWVVLIIVALALAKYFFDWSIFDALSSEQGRETTEYLKDVISTVWSHIKSWAKKIYEIF